MNGLATAYPGSPEFRFHVPMYTIADAAQYLALRKSTFHNWTRGFRPLVTCFSPDGSGQPSVPFVGLAEGFVLAAFRQVVSMQKLRPQIEQLRAQIGIEHALASKRLYRVGPELMYDYALRPNTDAEVAEAIRRDLVQLRDGQAVFAAAVEQYLQLISWSTTDEWASELTLPGYEVAVIVANPLRRFGQPHFLNGGATLHEVLGRAAAGEPVDELADDYGLDPDEVTEAVERAGLRAA